MLSWLITNQEEDIFKKEKGVHPRLIKNWKSGILYLEQNITSIQRRNEKYYHYPWEPSYGGGIPKSLCRNGYIEKAITITKSEPAQYYWRITEENKIRAFKNKDYAPEFFSPTEIIRIRKEYGH